MDHASQPASELMGVPQLHTILLDSVQRPSRIGPDAIQTCSRALGGETADENQVGAALDALAGILYARPDLDPTPAVAGVVGTIAENAMSFELRTRAAEMLRFLFASPAESQAVGAFLTLIGRQDLSPDTYPLLIDGLEQLQSWRPHLLDPATLVSLAEYDHLQPHRSRLLHDAITPELLAQPEAVTGPLIRRLTAAYSDLPSFRYVLWYLAGHGLVSAEARGVARSALPTFPLHAVVRDRLLGSDVRMLVVSNARDGQGDEILRVVPLVQALLDANPSARVTLVTGRPYLFAHPRLDVVPIHSPVVLQLAADTQFGVVMNFHAPTVPEVQHRQDIERVLLARQHSEPAMLWLCMAKANHENTFQAVDVDGQPWADRLGLDEPLAHNTHESVMRLLAELGLPVRLGEEGTDSEPVLAGLPWPDAETAWHHYTAGNDAHRPVVLLNPFGGALPLKGFTDSTMGSLVEVIRQLIADRTFILLLLNGESWGGAEIAKRVVSLLTPDERRFVALGPDPAEPSDGMTVLPNGIDASHASATMAIFTYFARWADLVVPVEGWLVHAAYSLGRPYRVLMAPYSFDFEWHPYGRSGRQRPYMETPSADPWDPSIPPPLVGRPRKSVLLGMLAALGRCPDAAGVGPLAAAIRSEDHHVRFAAATALGGHSQDPTAQQILLAALHDPWHRVRAAAAAGLERSGREYVAEIGPEYAAQLQAHQLIAATPRSWAAVFQLGLRVRPVLQQALQDEDFVIAREARHLAHAMQIPGGGQTPIQTRPAQKHSDRRLWRPGRRSRSKDPKVRDRVLILTPVKNAEDMFPEYVHRLKALRYPHDRISLGMLESDSVDDTYEAARRVTARLQREFGQARVWKRDFGYQVPTGFHRGHPWLQTERRVVLARSRNHLLFHALADEDWVLWLDVDVEEYPVDLIERLLATGKDIVQPHCVVVPGGPTFDTNGWRDAGRLHLDDLRSEGELVPLDAVGGTVLLIRADLHRDGLIFPAYAYGRELAPLRLGRDEPGEIETEGLAVMAKHMGYQCWGMPHLEVRHGDQ